MDGKFYRCEDTMPIPTAVSTVAGYLQKPPAPTTGLPLYAKGISAWNSVTSGSRGGVVKYDRNGRPLWWVQLTNGNVINAVATDSANAILAVGVMGNSGQATTTTIIDATGASVATLTSKGVDGVIVKLSSAGGVLWAAKVASTDTGNSITDQGLGVSVDSSDNVYVAGSGGGAASATLAAYNADGTIGASFSTSSGNGTDSFVVKYSPAGVVQWMAKMVSTQFDGAIAVTVDASGGVYVAGSTGSLTASSAMGVFNANGTLFGSFPNTAVGTSFLVKYDTSGTVQWIARPVRGSGTGSTAGSTARCLVTDSTNSVYVSGNTAGTDTYTAYNANGTAFANSISSAGSDAFLVKYNSSGTVQWLTKVASAGGESGNALAVGPGDLLYLAGGGGPGTITANNANGSSFATTIVTTFAVPFGVRYSSAGVVQAIWKILPAAGATGGGSFNSVATDRNGTVLFGGNAGTTLTPYINTLTDPLGGGVNMVGSMSLLAFTPAGAYRWVQRWQALGGGTTIIFSLATDRNCDIVAGGALGTSGVVYDVNPTIYGRVPAEPVAAPYPLNLFKYSSEAMPQWIARVEMSTTNRLPCGVSTDSSQNVYVTLVSSATVTPYSLATPAQSLVAQGGTAFGSVATGGTLTKIILIKYSSAGIVQWGAQITSTSNVPPTALRSATDSSGNTYVVFNYQTTVTIFNASGTTFGTLASLAPAAPAWTIGVVKYDTSGVVQWTARMGTTAVAGETIADAKVDTAGNLYLTGRFGTGTFTVYNSSGTAFARTFPNRGGKDAFFVKYDGTGAVQWVAAVASTADDSGYGLAIDSAGNVIGTGACNNTTTTGTVTTAYSSSGTAFGTTLANAGSGDAFVVKYNSAGTVQWFARISTTGASDYALCAATDSTGAVYVAGSPGSTGTITVASAAGTPTVTRTNTIGPVGFIAKYSSAGVAQWIVTMNSTDRSGSAYVRDMYVDSSDNIYALARATANLMAFTTTGAFFGSPAIPTDRAEFESGVVLKLNSVGTIQWMCPIRSVRITSAGNDNSTFYGPALATDSAANFYVWGRML